MKIDLASRKYSIEHSCSIIYDMNIFIAYCKNIHIVNYFWKYLFGNIFFGNIFEKYRIVVSDNNLSGAQQVFEDFAILKKNSIIKKISLQILFYNRICNEIFFDKNLYIR